MTGERILVATLFVAIGIVTWDELRMQHYPPVPRRYIGILFVWTVLEVIAMFGGEAISAAFACGMLLMMLYRFVLSGQSASARTPTKVNGQ